MIMFKTTEVLGPHLNQCFYWQEELRLNEGTNNIIIPSPAVEPNPPREKHRIATVKKSMLITHAHHYQIP